MYILETARKGVSSLQLSKLYSVQVGHYFATPRNRFWTAINRSGLLAEPVGAAQDHRLLRQGIGLTDVVKRATRGASELRAADFRQGGARPQREARAPSTPHRVLSREDRVSWLYEVCGRQSRPTGARCSASRNRELPGLRHAEPEPGQRRVVAGRPGRVVSATRGPTRRDERTMSDRIRAFLAVSPDAPVKSALADIVSQVRGTGAAGVALVGPDSIHLTLKFLGDISNAQVDAVQRAVTAAVSGIPELSLTLGRAGVFPSSQSPRVLWVGLEGDIDGLADLQRSAEQATAALGFARERRPFSPHLTIGRVRNGARPEETRRAIERLLAAKVPATVRLDVRSVDLVRSILLPSGAIYERLAQFPLAGQAQA